MNRLLLFTVFFIVAGWSGCGRADSNRPVTVSEEQKAEQTDTQIAIRYASRFSLSREEGFQAVHVLNPFKNRTDTLSYLMIPQGAQVEAVQNHYIPVEVPVQRLVIFSTTHAAMLEALNSHEVVVGIGGAQWIVSETFRQRIKEGSITPLPGAHNLALEQLIALNPDVVMIVGQFYTQFKKLQKLREMGIQVIVNSDWLETTPLGRAEWIKWLGLLTGKTVAAKAHFKQVEAEYKKVDALTEGIQNKPTVLMNLSFKNQWYVPGGNSYMAALLDDAGAAYPWADNTRQGGIPLDFETIYQTGLQADVWLNPGAADSIDDILQVDRRLQAFKPIKTGRVYNITKRKSPNGGYDFWERGIVHPEEILADITKILYPSKLPNYELIYYERVE